MAVRYIVGESHVLDEPLSWNFVVDAVTILWSFRSGSRFKWVWECGLKIKLSDVEL